ncbi:hypothetical protein BaRGS_00008101 [Batillaria attramentaria]|uniref:Uncharacterized protein n=1 Tax=Batillaria attramentaria TaxID=370345 RepID=A0ABD0LMP9_9CAEN
MIEFFSKQATTWQRPPYLHDHKESNSQQPGPGVGGRTGHLNLVLFETTGLNFPRDGPLSRAPRHEVFLHRADDSCARGVGVAPWGPVRVGSRL